MQQPSLRQRRTDKSCTGRCVCQVVDGQGEADGLESSGCIGQNLERGVVAVAGSTDVDGVFHLGTSRSCGDLAVFNGVAGCFEVAEGGLQSSSILGVAAHIAGVDLVAVNIGRVSDLVAVVGNGRSCPGSVGHGVVDDGCGVAVVRVDALITVSCDHGHDGLAQVLGLFRSRVVANLDVLSAQGNVAVAAEVLQTGGDDRAVEVELPPLMVAIWLAASRE